jgi:hypothetical protein
MKEQLFVHDQPENQLQTSSDRSYVVVAAQLLSDKVNRRRNTARRKCVRMPVMKMPVRHV